ncbi:MAG: glycoside hydrolase family 15 protein [Chloroflexi bacterium]|nr:glycoside hydrolase family 15 protein [Chloroflexota bacterium]
MSNLYQRSIQTIRSHQAPSGAYVASPHFPTYLYCWFRDGAFTAYAMDVAGEHESARRFHGWATRTVLRHADRAGRAIAQAQRGQPLDDDYLHTRYTLDGQTGSNDWPNFQTDGLGTWLWALAEHAQRTDQALPTEWEPAVGLVACYLAALWPRPCYDLWEEHPQHLHPYTLAALHAGLQAAAELRPVYARSWLEIAADIKRFVLTQGIRDGRLIKSMAVPSGSPADVPPLTGVDASLIGVSVPYRLLDPDDPLMQATVAGIETNLHRPGGGVYRYRADTYYGGGEWVLLAAWLGWYYAQVGRREQAGDLLRWIEAQADGQGHLPEQASAHLLSPSHYPEWESRWGAVARPLLWSHAMTVVLYHALAR